MSIPARFAVPILCAGIVIGLLLAGLAAFFINSDTRVDFLNATGYGVGIGLGAVAGIGVFNWLIGFVDRLKSGRL